MGGNDTIAEVIKVIEAYNDANMTSLTTDIMELAKSDQDPPFPDADFTFYDADMVTEITRDDVNSQPISYFEYTGSENLLYFSVKGGSIMGDPIGFSLYTYMPGKNLIELQGNNDKAVSHVTFWKGVVPEPASVLVWSVLGVVGTCLSRRSS